ncbi:MAG: hypothetical protein HY898_33255 [Deltaproteobacteria bacterium]|nr:hypothetical protein [Deltaproteobacteria bacterium]
MSKLLRNAMRSSILLLCTLAVSRSAQAACPSTSADCFTVVPCDPGLAGTCRLVTALTSAAIQDAVNVSADGDSILLPSGIGDWSQDPHTILIASTHNGGNGEMTLTDTTKSWVTDQWVGETLYNKTDGSSCMIESNTSTTMTCQWGALSGGAENRWDAGDAYEVKNVGVSWTDKNIRLMGAGIGQTTLVGDGTKFSVHAETKASFRISGMTLSGGTPGSVLSFKNGNNTPTSGFRVDHVHFAYTEDTATDYFFVNGLIYGVIDHCSVEAPGGILVQHYGYTEKEGAYSGTTSWSLPLDLGGPTAIYVEDSTIHYGSGWFPGMNDSWSGGRLVFRYNQLTRPVFQTHGARGNMRGGLKLEIYGNTMTSDGVQWDRLGEIRSGTGVFFNNTINGYQHPFADLDVPRVCDTGASNFGGWCDGTSPWDGNLGASSTGDPGWPCLDMPGRGTTASAMPGAAQPSEPYYAWRNGPEAGCQSGVGTCTPQDVFDTNGGYEKCDPGPPHTSDYVRVSPAQAPHAGDVFDAVNNGLTPKPGYAPYTYPHPLITDCSLNPVTCDRGAAGAAGAGGSAGAAGASGSGGAAGQAGAAGAAGKAGAAGGAGNAGAAGAAGQSGPSGSDSDGCGCFAAGRSAGGVGAALAAIAAIAAWRRRRRADQMNPQA